MRAHAAPLAVSGFGTDGQLCRRLEQQQLTAGRGGGAYSESWLQALIDQHPAVLPIEEIEPGLADAISICRELPTPSGFADNLLISPNGGIVIVEAKLWRNPQARREVVGQILDYAKDLARWSYEDLERAIGIARGERGLRLFDLLRAADPAVDDEAAFIDAVSRNLRLGRFLCLIVGDGIQESAEQLADFLQRHVGLHFTLSLVELSLWRADDSGTVLVLPRVIARTVQIERAVVRLESGVTAVAALAPDNSPTRGVSGPTTITEQQFYEQLTRANPALPAALKSFLTQLEPLGVFGELRKHLSLKWRAPDGRDYHLGVVDTGGQIVTDYCNWSANNIGRLDLSHAYMAELASLLPGGSVKQTPKPTGWRLVVGDKNPPVAALLDRADGWSAAILHYAEALDRAVQG